MYKTCIKQNPTKNHRLEYRNTSLGANRSKECWLTYQSHHLKQYFSFKDLHVNDTIRKRCVLLIRWTTPLTSVYASALKAPPWCRLTASSWMSVYVFMLRGGRELQCCCRVTRREHTLLWSFRKPAEDTHRKQQLPKPTALPWNSHQCVSILKSEWWDEKDAYFLNGRLLL